jgi:hypothetical protein
LDGINDEDVYVFYRKSGLIKYKVQDDKEDLPDHIMERLAQARAKAMEAYRSKWA